MDGGGQEASIGNSNGLFLWPGEYRKFLVLTEFVVNVSGLQRGSNQEVMQPVWLILKTVQVVKRRHPRRLVTPQAHTIRVKVSLQRHSPYGQAGTVGGTVPRAHGVEQPVLVVE